MRLREALATLSAAAVLGGCASTTAPAPASSSVTSAQTATSAQADPTASSTATSTAARDPRPGDHRQTGSGTETGAAGLAATAGYGSYADCQGTCTGGVPAALRRPLALPAADGGPCPVTLRAGGPIDESGSTQIGFHTVQGSTWLSAGITWTAKGYYQGPVLIRGRQIGGSGVIGFGSGPVLHDELQLLDAGSGAPAVAGGGRAWLTQARVTGPGCYGFQVDGSDFSEVLVFRAVG